MPKSYRCNKNLKLLCFGKNCLFGRSKTFNHEMLLESNKNLLFILHIQTSMFQEQFVLRNHKSRQKVKNAIKKYLFKLMNNANFGRDCSDNAM